MLVVSRLRLLELPSASADLMKLTVFVFARSSVLFWGHFVCVCVMLRHRLVDLRSSGLLSPLVV